MIHKKKEKRRTFCYLKPTVVATEGTEQVMANVVDKNLNSTLVTTEVGCPVVGVVFLS